MRKKCFTTVHTHKTYYMARFDTKSKLSFSLPSKGLKILAGGPIKTLNQLSCFNQVEHLVEDNYTWGRHSRITESLEISISFHHTSNTIFNLTNITRFNKVR